MRYGYIEGRVGGGVGVLWGGHYYHACLAGQAGRIPHPVCD
jgi:hypothetical protein